jgi:hypothetical protein
MKEDKIDPMRSTIKEIINLGKKKDQLETEIYDRIKKAYPIDRVFLFYKGKSCITARVIDHESFKGDRIKIENCDTNKEYWIGVNWVLAGDLSNKYPSEDGIFNEQNIKG